MNAHTGFWTFAIMNMFAAFVVAAFGVRAARRKDVDLHKKLMMTSAALVVLFVLTYAGKLVFIGRENLDVWSDGEIIVLRVHELFVFTFLASGIRAYLLSRKFSSDPANRERHRLAGRISVISFALALVTAGFVYRSILEYGLPN